MPLKPSVSHGVLRPSFERLKAGVGAGHTQVQRLAIERSSLGDIAGHVARTPGRKYVGIVSLCQSERDESLPAVLRRMEFPSPSSTFHGTMVMG